MRTARLLPLAALLFASPALAQPDAEVSPPQSATPTPPTPATPPTTPTPTPTATPTATATATATGPTAEDWTNAQQGNTLRATSFAEDRAPPGTTGPGASSNDIQFGAHGYFRAPFRMSWKRRENTTADESKYNLRTPWLVDDDYYRSGFAYTPVNESDYTELFIEAGNKNVTATVALMGSLYSDSGQPLIDKQQGISQGYVTYRYATDAGGVPLRIRVKGGAFWDRFGYLPKYDTYIFGRTHQMGEQVKVDADVGKFTFSALHGVGAHLEALDANQGLSLLNYFRLGAAYDRFLEAGLYYLRTWTQDKRQLKELTDASMRVIGVDARLDTKGYGKLYLAGAILDADQATYLSPTLEVLHSFGGRGITENYLGADKSDNGTGTIKSFGFQYDLSFKQLFQTTLNENPFGRGDVQIAWFGLYSYVLSHQFDLDPAINRNERKMFKYGLDFTYWALHWLGAGVRYDRVVLNVDDDANTFRIFAPRVAVRTDWLEGGQIFLQWSRYSYNDRVRLRPGQIPLETIPDDNVVKIQAQFAF